MTKLSVLEGNVGGDSDSSFILAKLQTVVNSFTTFTVSSEWVTRWVARAVSVEKVRYLCCRNWCMQDLGFGCTSLGDCMDTAGGGVEVIVDVGYDVCVGGGPFSLIS